MADLAELLAAADASFVERMKTLTTEADAKSKELADRSQTMMSEFTQAYSDLLKNPIKIERTDEQRTAAGSAEATEDPAGDGA